MQNLSPLTAKKVINPSLRRLVWGCDHRLQFEYPWICRLVEPADHFYEFRHADFSELSCDTTNVLVESGLLTLKRSRSQKQYNDLQLQRKIRIQQLSDLGNFSVIHLSDEEGIDGDSLYPLLPRGTVIWRNFYHPRHCKNYNASCFPIGPRGQFLKSSILNFAKQPASQRLYPWAFMGTLWTSGSRFLATSLFLHALPKGFYFGGNRFGQGLPMKDYKNVLLQSSFALCPEGDRHLDTFRLHECLQAGCIPVVVDNRSMAPDLLGDNPPFPVFNCWPDALRWVQQLLNNPPQLDEIQSGVSYWWHNRKSFFANVMRSSLFPSSSRIL